MRRLFKLYGLVSFYKIETKLFLWKFTYSLQLRWQQQQQL